MEKTGLISTDTVQEALTDAVRRHVGKGKLFSTSDFAALAGVSEKTVYAIREGGLIPSFETLLRFATILPVSFMSDIISPAGLGGVERIERPPVNAPGVLADLADRCASVSDRLRDGVFCHVDCSVTGPELIELAHKLEAQGRAMIEKAGG